MNAFVFAGKIRYKLFIINSKCQYSMTMRRFQTDRAVEKLAETGSPVGR